MKRIVTLLLAGAMALSLAACGGSAKSEAPAAAPAASSAAPAAASAQVSTSGASEKKAPAAEIIQPATEGQYVVVTVDPKADIYDDSAWVGLVPADTDFLMEADADEVDYYYTYCEYREEKDPYVFNCDFSGVEDGIHNLILTSSDDASVGYVIAQVEIEKKGDAVSFNFAKSKLNEKPADLILPEEEHEEEEEEPEEEEEEEEFDPADYENLEIGVEDLGEDFTVTMKNDTPMGDMTVVSLYDYDGDTLDRVVFTYYVPDSTVAEELMEYLKDEPVKQESIEINGATVTCELADKDVEDLRSVDKEMLLMALRSTVS